RVMNIYPVKQFSRKDGTQFLLRTMTVYDGDSRAKVKLWDEKANLPGIENLKPGDLVKIIKAYVKADMKGNPIINVGSGAAIEPNKNSSIIPTLDAITEDISNVKENQQGLELHGDEGTVVEIEGATEIQPIVIRILSMTKSESGNSLIVGVQEDKKLVNISDLTAATKDLQSGDVIECMPSKVYGNSITLEVDSFVKKIDGKKIPTLSELRTKIKDIRPADGTYCIEAIILKST